MVLDLAVQSVIITPLAGFKSDNYRIAVVVVPVSHNFHQADRKMRSSFFEYVIALITKSHKSQPLWKKGPSPTEGKAREAREARGRRWLGERAFRGTWDIQRAEWEKC